MSRMMDEFKIGLGASFPGIYLTAIRSKNASDYRQIRYASVSIIIDPYLLNRHDYHINVADYFGKIVDETFSRESLADFLDHLTVYSIGEIVFHNVIEPAFFKFIANYDPERAERAHFTAEKKRSEQVQHLLDKLLKKPKELNFYETDHKIIDSVYAPLLRDEETHPVRFCTTYLASDGVKSLFKVAKNCGFSNQEIASPEFSARKEIETRFRKITSKSAPVPKTVYFPPFETTPLEEQDRDSFYKFKENKDKAFFM